MRLAETLDWKGLTLLALQTPGGYNILDVYLEFIDLECLPNFGWDTRGKNPL
jgi:hypothetical protein